MANKRINIIACLLKGLVTAILFTLLLMLILALCAVYLKLSDTAIMWANQFIKVFSIIIGVAAGVGRGGENGFIKGMVLAMVYMILGYVLCIASGEHPYSTVSLLGEILIGAAVGSISGAVFANLSLAKARRR